MKFLPIFKKGLRAVASGLTTGIASGVGAAAYRKASGGEQYNNAGSGMGQVHEQMFGNRSQQFDENFELQRQQNDHDVRLQWMKDNTAIDLQKMQMKHDAIMSSVSRGHEGVKEVIDFFLGKEKDQFWKEYRDIMGNK